MPNRLDKHRAEFAFNCVKNFIEQNKDKERQKKYRSYIRNTPSLILNNGLGATFAFIFSKQEKSDSKEVYLYIAQNIYDWLKKEENQYLIKLEGEDKLQELMKKTIELNTTEYRAVTNEVLALLVWFKRFVEGMIEMEDKEDGKKEEE